MWRSLATGDLRTTVLSLDAVLTDIGFIVGPTLAAFLVTMVAPWAGLAASAVLNTSATLLLLSRQVPQQRNQQSAKRDWLGPLRSVPLRRTMTAAVLFYLAVRAIELAFPAWAQEHNAPLMSGVLLSSMAVGSVVGGLVLGALPPSWARRAKLPVTLATLCLGTLLAAAASQGGGSFLVVAAAVMGLALGPTFVALFATAGDLSPANMAAETQSWLSSSMSLGGAVGTSVAGLVSQSFGPGTVLVVAAASMAAATGLARLGTSKQAAAPLTQQPSTGL
jgi:MFS family permease